MQFADDHLIEVSISVVAAYGTYLLADRLHESGIIATVVVGLVLGNAGGSERLSERTREALDITWEFVAFLLTALTFLLVGLVISPGLLSTALPVIAAGYLAITVARVLVVYVLIGDWSEGHPRSPSAPRGLPPRHVLGGPARRRRRGTRTCPAGVATPTATCSPARCSAWC